jgi:signal peptidase I
MTIRGFVLTVKKSGFWESVRTIIYAIVIALVVRTAAYEPFNIPSGSMLPTLLVGDYLFVAKFSYGYSRYSLPFGLPLISGRVFSGEPERGDVAVFKLPTDNKTDYIKRIVGLPGDRIQMREGRLYINEVLVDRERIGDFVASDGATVTRLTQYIETLPNGRRHRILESSDTSQLDNTRVYVVPPRHYFAMGDNRDNSLDSRVLGGVGFVPFENLIGRAEFLFFSTDGSAQLWEVWKWPFAIRYGRLFEAVSS